VASAAQLTNNIKITCCEIVLLNRYFQGKNLSQQNKVVILVLPF
jgi:hypothetical protein